METGHSHGRQQVLASNLAYGRPATERPTLIAARQSGSIRRHARRESRHSDRPIGQAQDCAGHARPPHTQINRYAKRHQQDASRSRRT